LFLNYHRRVAKRILIALIICWAAATAEAQPFDSLPLAQGKPARPSTWKQPMTPWGEPDLRGTWPLNHLISTPFQRPEQFGPR
jgi:hypothetical protein